MPPVPIENYGMQSHDDLGQTEQVMDPISDTERTSRNIAAEIAALLEETPDYDDEVPDDDEEDTLKTAPLAPVRHKRRSKTSSEEEERVRRSSCFKLL